MQLVNNLVAAHSNKINYRKRLLCHIYPQHMSRKYICMYIQAGMIYLLASWLVFRLNDICVSLHLHCSKFTTWHFRNLKRRNNYTHTTQGMERTKRRRRRKSSLLVSPAGNQPTRSHTQLVTGWKEACCWVGGEEYERRHFIDTFFVRAHVKWWMASGRSCAHVVSAQICSQSDINLLIYTRTNVLRFEKSQYQHIKHVNSYSAVIFLCSTPTTRTRTSNQPYYST